MTMTTLQKVSSSVVSKKFAFYYDEAISHPIAVERNGAARVVMMPLREYERLARLDHRAVAPEELTDDEVNALRTAEAPPESFELNELLGSASSD